ncbi:Zinc finger PHD-type [Arabidopsis suecica]|uniref:Zinc finger PHD-type n=1 Tax=Arabidopsis suecica TaxID=45249 RepID=A0A8T1ZBW7_ARASU|nr:Zinc finger PHD-type [Arabidopsis suecica]
MADRRVGKRQMGQRGFSKVESGTCNVCSAPCSSCMHRNVGFTGSKLDEASDENCHGVVGSQCSVNEDDLLPSFMVNAHNSLNNTASEASNLVNSSHDALSENAESKETIRFSGISDDSGAVAMTSKTSLSGSRMKHKVSASAKVLDQSSNCIEGQEDGILSDDRAKKLNPGYSNNKMGNKDSAGSSALNSDPMLGGSWKDEVKLQSLHNPSSNHDDRVSSERGNFKEKSGPGGDKERQEPSVEGSTRSGENRKDGKSSKSSSSNSPAVSESESDDSEMVEHDVKVCDICGDAGREDLLAICSGCSDGAEHTYCMRERLNEVPGGDWLCEECAEEAEKQKQDAKRKRETEVTLNTHSSGKRHAEKIEAAPDAKRQAVAASTGSPKKSILPRIGSLSRETSFKGLDRLRGKLNHQTSFSDDTESARSTGSLLQPPKGAFLKSSSFNCSSSKPKVQLRDDAIHPRQKTGKEYTALDLKEGGFRNVGKSMPSRTTDAGNSSGNDSQTKMLGSKVYHAQEGKSLKQVKDRNREANASASSMDQKLKSRGNTSVSHANNNRDLKGLQSDGKRGNLTKQVSNLHRNRLENPVVSGGDISTNEKCSASEQSSSQADCKDELPSTSLTGEGMPNHGTVALQDGLSRSRESREVGKKSKGAFNKSQRSSLLSGAKGLPLSQKGGQTAESSDTSGVSDSDLSTTKNVKEDLNKGNRLRAAVDAALRKKPNFGKNRVLEQSDTSLVANVDSSSDKTLRNQLPSKVHKNYVSHEGLQGGHPTLWPASDPYKQTIVTNEKQLVFSGADTLPPRSLEPEVNFPSVKPVMRDLPLVPSPVMLRSSAIPDHEFIWQGDLEVRKIRNQSAMHSGMQAHLSTLASPRVAEVVNKFPETFSLNEVPRESTWPAQFEKLGIKEDHIALFFFAKDIESYERNYKPLVDNMIKNDLALKGNLDNLELLIFASNQLPSNCQRWNMLYFLWGVFQGRKESCTNPQKNTSLPTSNVLPRDRDPNELCETSAPSKHLEKASSLRESSSNGIETRNGTDLLSHENPNNRESLERSPSTKEDITLKVEEAGVNHIPPQATGSNSGDSLVREVQQIEEQELGGRKDLPLTVMGSGIQSHGQDNPLEKDLNCSQASHRKRPLWELTRPANENSSAINQKVELNNDGLCEGSPNKKLKTEDGSSSLCRDTSGHDSGIMKKSPKVVFPLDLNVERDDSELIDNISPLGNDDNNDSNNKRRLISGAVPNLELALGAEETTEEGTMGLLPFLSGSSNSGEQSNNSMKKEKQKADEEEDDAAVAASLSLSLSFPGTEERKNVNTPLFLFRDLPR